MHTISRINKTHQEGFTLIELLVVVVILGILAAVATPNFVGAMDKAKNSSVQANAHSVQLSLEMYGQDNGSSYPADLGAVIGLNTGYMEAYPQTPWNTTQTAHITPTASVAVNSPFTGLGAVAAAPSTYNHYGSIHYTRGGTANSNYEITATGKRSDRAVNIIYLKNY